MKTSHDLLSSSPTGNVMLDNMFKRYVNNTKFRGFYYSVNEINYGIILEFGKTIKTSFKLIANTTKQGRKTVEYSFESNNFSIESISYDKLLISTRDFTLEKILDDNTPIQLPEQIEFTIQLLTRNSMYIHFKNQECFSAPIRSLKGGMVLSKDIRASLFIPKYETLGSEF